MALQAWLIAAAAILATPAQSRPLPVACAAAVKTPEESPPDAMTKAYGDGSKRWALYEGSVCAARRGDFRTAEELYDALWALDRELGRLLSARLGASAAQTKEGATLALRVLEKGEPPGDVGIDRAAALLLLGRDDEVAPLMERLRMAPIVQIDRRFKSLWKSEIMAAAEIGAINEAGARMLMVLLGLETLEFELARVELLLGKPSLALSDITEPEAITARYGRDSGIAESWEPRAIRARALVAVGRLDEAVSLVEAEPGGAVMGPHAVEAIGLVTLGLVRADRPKDAGALLDATRPRYGGDRERALLEDCVSARLGKRAPEAPRYLPRPYAGEPYLDLGFVLESLLCAGRDDEAADALLLALEDPDLRRDGLLEVQRYRQWPELGVFDHELRESRRALLARPEVVAAVARHGRVLDLPTYEPNS